MSKLPSELKGQGLPEPDGEVTIEEITPEKVNLTLRPVDGHIMIFSFNPTISLNTHPSHTHHSLPLSSSLKCKPNKWLT